MTTSVTTGTGGPTENALRRALRRARDGVSLDVSEAAGLLQARGTHLDDLSATAGRVRDAGRDPAALQIVPYAVHPSPGKLAYYAELGIEEVVVQLPPAGEADVLKALDEYAPYLPDAADNR